ncbi:uncharacterized protein LOC117321126 [Pecten maximus]|uniref:uncharacterized protein LOC117321126 n=1 Tax=Pecten maximus TaxID=6579 RepID=UPI001458BDF6|nr:uncharacterized protein LOC117321126 [Pecten maximus]
MELCETFGKKDVEHLGDCSFQVSSQSSVEKTTYRVNLNGPTGMPSCDCHNWQWTLLPCKHMFAVFAHTDYSWEDIAAEYRSLPSLTIDSQLPAQILQLKKCCVKNLVLMV